MDSGASVALAVDDQTGELARLSPTTRRLLALLQRSALSAVDAVDITEAYLTAELPRAAVDRLGRYHYEVARHNGETLLRQLLENVQWGVGESVHEGLWQIRPAVGWARVGDCALCVCVLIRGPGR